MKKLFLATLTALVVSGPVMAETVTGPVGASVVSVYDGDTITVDAKPWPGMTMRVSVRLLGIDTPEIRGECPEETALAKRARDRLVQLIGARVQLYDLGNEDRYVTRIDADVWVGDLHPAAVLIAEGLGRPYSGGKRGSWCAE